jgi:hypothetical protein
MLRPRLYEWAMRAARLVQRTFGLPRGAGPLRAWSAGRELRPLAPRSFRELWRAGLKDQ